MPWLADGRRCHDVGMPSPFVKRRAPATPGSIPDILQMFVNEVRFYREIAPVIGVRVPECFRAEENGGATLLELEDLSAWRPGARPTNAARLLAGMHRRWGDEAARRWPWLRAPDEVVSLVAEVYDSTWPVVSERADCTPAIRDLGSGLTGRVPEAERLADQSGPMTLVHGDPSARNMRTSPSGEIALLDWEDVRLGPGVSDLAWLLVSSVDPDDWDDTIEAYGDATGLGEALPSSAVQGVLSLADTAEHSDSARGWIDRLEETSRRLAIGPTGAVRQ
jgi:hypothetical protein